MLKGDVLQWWNGLQWWSFALKIASESSGIFKVSVLVFELDDDLEFDLNGGVISKEKTIRSFKSKEDFTMKISNSVSVTNFPGHFSAQDLWKVCNAYGKVDNLDRLIGNLCTIWIGRFHLYANPVRFQRESRVSTAQQSKGKEEVVSIVLLLHRLVWVSVEGMPIKTWTHKTFDKIVSLWGSLSEVEDEEDSSLPYKKLCVITKPHILIDNKIKVIVKGRVYLIRVKELEAWSPDFSNYLSDNDTEEDESDDDIHRDQGDSKSNDPIFPLGFTPVDENENVGDTNGDSINQPMEDLQTNKEGLSSSKSGNHRILNLKPGGSILEVMESLVEIGQTMGYNMEGCLGQSAKKCWIQEINRKHKVNFVTIQETKMEDIGLFTVKALWGSFSYDFAFSPSVGSSGGILCVWDPNMFIKDSVSISDSFLAIRGDWIDEHAKVKNEFLNHFTNRYWEIIVKDVVNAVRNFSVYSSISLGYIYKIIAKILANRLSLVISDLVSDVQFALVSNRQILDVPLGVLNKMESLRWNFFNGVDNKERKLSMIGWKKVLASKYKGSWMYLAYLPLTEPSYSNGIEAMYGDHGFLDNPGSLSQNSPWSDIIKEAASLSLKEDVWLDDHPLKLSFPRLYALECDKEVSLAAKLIDSSLTGSFRRNPRGGIEEKQYLLLVEKVASMILSNSNDR
ncbi:hypothetical protein Tco_0676201 [Tanacetum coccineum]